MLLNHKTVKEGKVARRVKKGRADNPYQRDTPEWLRWWAGWNVVNARCETSAECPTEKLTFAATTDIVKRSCPC